MYKAEIFAYEEDSCNIIKTSTIIYAELCGVFREKNVIENGLRYGGNRKQLQTQFQVFFTIRNIRLHNFFHCLESRDSQKAKVNGLVSFANFI